MAKRTADSVSPGSVLRLLGGLLRGCSSAFARIVTRYRPQVTRDAKQRMGPHLARAVDAEDLALSAFGSLWDCLQKERDQPLCLGDRNDLLRLLGEITLQKIRMARRYHTRQKRDVRRTVLEADATDGPEPGSPLAQLLSREPPPDWEPVFQETLAAWLAELRPGTSGDRAASSQRIYQSGNRHDSRSLEARRRAAVVGSAVGLASAGGGFRVRPAVGQAGKPDLWLAGSGPIWAVVI